MSSSNEKQLFENSGEGKKDSSGVVSRRAFIASSAAVSLPLSGTLAPAMELDSEPGVYRFTGADSDYHGHHWQTLNPGYWKIESGALRRRLHNYGDRARRTGFPFHAETNGFEYKTEYDPSLPSGVLYSNHWYLKEDYVVRATFTYHQDRPEPGSGDDSAWAMYQDGYGLMGIALGGKSVLQSFEKLGQLIRVVWADDGRLKIIGSVSGKRAAQGGLISAQDRVFAESDPVQLMPGETCELKVRVVAAPEKAAGQVRIVASLDVGQRKVAVEHRVNEERISGYTGIVARGMIDFQVDSFVVEPGRNKPRNVGVADCLSCYPLGDTLKQVKGVWRVRMVGIFASDGEQVQVRVADTPSPEGGWGNVPICGIAAIVNHEWRRHTAVIDVALPHSPSETTQYYTIWKDGIDVTSDDRIGTDSCGPGTGLVGDVPKTGKYVGRLPRLAPPYKICGLSCHAITAGLQQRQGDRWQMTGAREAWQYRDQPTRNAYQHLEEYDFQIMLWEDDVWYMELVMYPPSTDDAYKIIAWSICGPTSRWQMMRHWNVLNPGDHDYGMDDVKGPEQLAIRNQEGLGQDTAYMQRNFQIVHHLTTGAEQVDASINPRKWRAWKMPLRDFTFVVLDSRLWRSSQDVDIWDDQGWGKFKSLYSRTDPTRSLLGEEQFGWFQELLATDSSPLIGVTGVNGLHTVWAGTRYQQSVSTDHPRHFHERDRVTADYAGWVKAGADRVLELMGSRSGVVSVYGDVHNGCIMTNRKHRVVECSFGPIGRSGGRALVPGFARQMRDVDDRELEVHALYHKQFCDPEQTPHQPGEPFYWNFLEMSFDTRGNTPEIGMRIRNLVDAPGESPRGGGTLEIPERETGRPSRCVLPDLVTLPNADVFLTGTNGKPIRGTRSDENGKLKLYGLPDIEPGTRIVINAYDGVRSDSDVVTTKPIRS